MVISDVSSLVWWITGIQVLGLCSAWLARFSEGSAGQRLSQVLFFTCLSLVGGSTVFALTLGPSYWLISGVTLALMVLAAVWDFAPKGTTAAWEC